MKLILVNGQKIIKILEAKGFRPVRKSSSHVQLENNAKSVITVPVHSGTLIGRGLLRKILRDAEMSTDEYERLRLLV